MALSAGTRLGPYQILSPLGVGGMGEVYRAHDSRLDRDVAIKVLPEHLSRDNEALTRFQREAKVVAAMSHPNILTIFDCGTEENISFAVTELLEGETLRTRMMRETLTLSKILEIAVAVAEGLSAAHSKGIVHRDLKPENIFLISDGRVKVLDFGLARWKAGASTNEKVSPTMDTFTSPGVVVGTIQYMSPEQVRGLPVDARSDIFSFGCLLYEIITGKNPFARETVAETMAAILRDDPPELAMISGKTSPGLADIVRRCLQKMPDERYGSAAELLAALRVLNVSGSSSFTSADWNIQGNVKRKWHWAWIATAFVMIALISAGVMFHRAKGSQTAIDSLAVLPFENAGGSPDAEYLSDGITGSIIDGLSQIQGLRVMARST
ncbi:MAG: hypothetical protein C5B54_07515, partial [Acidobacteria bacterium]